jgi:hypothetical protein
MKAFSISINANTKDEARVGLQESKIAQDALSQELADGLKALVAGVPGSRVRVIANGSVTEDGSACSMTVSVNGFAPE